MGTVGLRGDIVLDDPLALGTWVGLSANSVKYKVGLGGVYGKDINDADIKAIPVYGDVVVKLPAEWLGGLDTYVSGGANYVVYGSGRKTGSYGVQGAAGVNVDLGLGLGKTGIEVGYAIVRANGSTPTLSAKGITFAVSQPLVL